MRGSSIIVLLFSLVAASATWAQELQFESGVEQTALIELYTSEGCSSCPPAEEYLNGYVDNPQLWKRFVPVALHVDYWDYLGWKDRFSSAQNSNRQRDYARVNGMRTVYTPGFFVNGKPWRPGLIRKKIRLESKPVGNLNASLIGDRLEARFEAVPNSRQPEVLHVALLGMDLSTRIRAGENKGRFSRHEFVLLKHLKVPGAGPRWRTSIPGVEALEADRLALAIWISEADDPTPIQAAGAYLPNPSPARRDTD